MLPLTCSQPEPCCAVRTPLRLTLLSQKSGHPSLSPWSQRHGMGSVFDSPPPLHPLPPLLQKFEGPIAVIVAPTRELAEQIHKEARECTRSRSGVPDRVAVDQDSLAEQLQQNVREWSCYPQHASKAQLLHPPRRQEAASPVLMQHPKLVKPVQAGLASRTACRCAPRLAA